MTASEATFAVLRLLATGRGPASSGRCAPPELSGHRKSQGWVSTQLNCDLYTLRGSRIGAAGQAGSIGRQGGEQIAQPSDRASPGNPDGHRQHHSQHGDAVGEVTETIREQPGAFEFAFIPLLDMMWPPDHRPLLPIADGATPCPFLPPIPS